MRAILLAAIALGVGAGTAFAGDSFNTVGSAIGFDVYSVEGRSVLVGSTSVGTPVLSIAEPGLRIGRTMGGEKYEVAAMFGYTIVAAESHQESVFGAMLDVNRLFQAEPTVHPYVGIHGGLLGAWASGETFPSGAIGGHAGTRVTIASGHGDIRIEARETLVHNAAWNEKNVGVFGFRVGYDLWFRK